MSNELEIISNQIIALQRSINDKKTSRLEDSLFSPELSGHYSQLAQQLAKSNVIPKQYIGKPTDIFVAMAMGYQLGLPVEQAIQDIAVINGRPCLWGDGLLAVCSARPDFEDIIEEPILEQNIIVGYQCTVKRKNRSPTVRIFTHSMAKKAGLLGKPGPWTQYPERMLQLRARANALRDSFADALRGIKSAEEVQDYIDVEYQPIIDSKESRTEQLKKDFITKTGINDAEAILETSTLESTISTEQTNAQTSQDTIVPAMDETRREENKADMSDVKIRTLTDEQLDMITCLLKEKAFTDERLEKALTYYGATSIESMPTEEASHFINQLQKA